MRAFWVRDRVWSIVLVGGMVLGVAVSPRLAIAHEVSSEEGLFSVDLGAASVCFVEPASLRSNEECDGVDPAALEAPAAVVDPLRRLAYGVVRGPGVGRSRPVIGTVTMLRSTSHATSLPDAAMASAVGDEIAASVTASLPEGAQVLPVVSKIAWGKDVPVIRTSLETSAASASSEADPAARREILTVVGGRYVYTTVWSGTREQASTLQRLADAAASSTDLKPQARPQRALNPWPGRLLFGFGVLGLALLRFGQKRASGVAKKPAAPSA
jgi:hypothetical protein